jgi:acyl-CoA thioester hydrolase
MPGRKYTYETIVRETHLDAFGHMNHARYLEVFEDARWDLISRNGYDLRKIEAIGLGPIILEVRVRYRRELRARQSITVETQCLSYEGKIGRIAQRMLDQDGRECCTAEVVVGLFDIRARRLVPPTPDWKRAVGLDEPEALERSPERSGSSAAEEHRSTGRLSVPPGRAPAAPSRSARGGRATRRGRSG